ncbi:MAG: pinensin family lanthipeptide [Bacteroidota bacterium]
MSKKKYQLSELKVKSFVTAIDKQEQKTSKGGYYYINNFNRIDYKHSKFTDHKTMWAERPRVLQSFTGKPGLNLD